jgi:hypothetical protein
MQAMKMTVSMPVPKGQLPKKTTRQLQTTAYITKVILRKKQNNLLPCQVATM